VKGINVLRNYNRKGIQEKGGKKGRKQIIKKGARNYYTKEIIHSVVLLGFGALKMETVYFSETLVSSCESTRRQNSEQHRPPHRCENFTSQIIHI
jgi:hypothetical protein